MITKKEILKLGYIKKTELIDGSTDYSHKTQKGHLLNLKNSLVTIIFPNKTNKDNLNFESIENISDCLENLNS